MSETYDGGDGWVQNEEGDVVAPDTNSSINPQKVYANRAELAKEHPEYNEDPDNIFDPDDFNPEVGLTREQARELNERAEKDRGYPVTPNPDDVMELPGKDGRPTNWKSPKDK